ncbi:MAG: HDIG domain-containing protein [Candidatus Pacearchaeota archaeon]
MPSLPISRNEAIELLKNYNTHSADIIHYLETEAVMRELAKFLGEDEEYWGMLGLLHDIDWGITKEDVKTHLTKAGDILRNAGFDERFIKIIISHGYGSKELPHLEQNKRSEKVEFALACSETVTGLIHAYALMRGKKISDMSVSGLVKKFKDKTIAAKVEREIILECKNIGIPLEKFLEIAINGIKKIKERVGLS